METNNIKKYFESKTVYTIILVIMCSIFAIVIFRGGMEVGYMKASFRYQSDKNYYHPGSLPDEVSGAHGVTGKIVSINLPKIVVADKDNTEKTVQIEDDSVLRELHNTISATDLKNGDFVVIIGEPNEVTDLIEAKFIRVIPQIKNK